MPLIDKICSASVVSSDSEPKRVLIQSTGTVTTSGWKNPELAPWFYITTPTDRILDVDFAADVPTGYVAEVVSALNAEVVLDRDPDNFWGEGIPLAGVRIHARSNAMTAEITKKLPIHSLSTPFAGNTSRRVFGGGGDPWPWRTAQAPFLVTEKRIRPDEPIGALLGQKLRVYKTGDGLTKDIQFDRANIELDPHSNLIVDVWFG